MRSKRGLLVFACAVGALALVPASAWGVAFGPATDYPTGRSVSVNDPPPSIDDLRLDPDEFRAGPGRIPLADRGTTIRFTLSETATVNFRVRRNPPRKNGGPPPRHSHRFTRELEAGEQAVRFTGTLDGRTFPAGRYLVYARAVDDAGNQSERQSAPFEITRGDPGGTACALKPNANCDGADLSGVDLSGMDLHGASFANANLSKATIRGANLAGANLSRANLSLVRGSAYGDQKPVDLSGVHADRANFHLANLASAKIQRASFSNALMSGVIAPRADLTRASFFQTDLTGGELIGATLQDADFSYAMLILTDLSQATGEFISGPSTVFCDTTMPDGSKLTRNCHGAA